MLNSLIRTEYVINDEKACMQQAQPSLSTIMHRNVRPKKKLSLSDEYQYTFC